ncbi:MAG: hypothetical protein ACHRHE_18535 [Tepidisphaerales bacterium]
MVKRAVAVVTAIVALGSINCNAPTRPVPATRAVAVPTIPAVTADCSSPKAAARSMLLAIKANDVDAFMACVALVPSGTATAAVDCLCVQREVALHRLTTAVLQRWGKDAFGTSQNKLHESFLAVSDAMIDRRVALIDHGTFGVGEKLVRDEKNEFHVLEGDDAWLNFDRDPDLQTAGWHGAIIDCLQSGCRFKRVGQAWILDPGPVSAEVSDSEAAAKEYARLRHELEECCTTVEQLAREVERGRFNSVEELVAELQRVPSE